MTTTPDRRADEPCLCGCLCWGSGLWLALRLGGFITRRRARLLGDPDA